MLTRLFGPKKIATPLLDACHKVDERVLHSFVETAPMDKPGKKGTALSMLIMIGTASLVDGLKWDEAPAWLGSDRFWRGMNMDVVAAEAMVFLNWDLVQRYHHSATADRPTFPRVGIEAMGDVAVQRFSCLPVRGRWASAATTIFGFSPCRPATPPT